MGKYLASKREGVNLRLRLTEGRLMKGSEGVWVHERRRGRRTWRRRRGRRRNRMSQGKAVSEGWKRRV